MPHHALFAFLVGGVQEHALVWFQLIMLLPGSRELFRVRNTIMIERMNKRMNCKL